MALGVAASALLFVKVDRLEEIAARNSVILERIDEKMDKVAADTGAIRDKVQTVSFLPGVESFPGYVGFKVDEPKDLEAIERHIGNDGWLYVPQE
ncbi:hypothetical protein [Pseudooceanicola sp.]|uniref:hypothetical protein n=1 Tax=Pseudooceanicola sp. TaxID=1914328 RepID=UPI00405821DA